MKRHPIGATGLEVTEIGFGSSGLGSMPDTYGYAVDEDRARATVRAMFDSPVNLLDTSNIYGTGRSEERIGAVIRERGGLPEGFVISTKLDRDAETGRFDASRARRSLEESLERLGVDHVQILHLHDPEHVPNIEEITAKGGALDELLRMKEEGLTQAVGLAMGRLDMMVPLLRDWPFDVLMSHNRYTLLNRSADAMFEEAQAKGIAILNAAPYASGVLSKGSAAMPLIAYQPATEEQLAPVRRIEAACARLGVPLGAVALQFSCRDQRIASTVAGVTRPDSVAETIEWATTQIPADLWRELEDVPFSNEDPEANRDYKVG